MGEALAVVKKYPLVAVAGVGGVAVLAFVASRSSGGAEPIVTEEPEAEGSDLFGQPPIDLDAGSPYAGGSGGGYYDPFGPSGPDPFGGSTDPGYGQTSDGCTWPPPAIPAGYEGRGQWTCDAITQTWTWNWITPPGDGDPAGDTSRKGCPLPRPVIPTRLVGQYRYECNGRTKRWELVKIKGGTPPPPGPTPPPPPGPTPQPNVARGGHVTFAGSRNARNQLQLRDRRELTLARAARWELGPAEAGDRDPGQGRAMVKVRKIRAAPGHAGQVGRWLKVG